jgi:exonuclease VII small subunit
VNFEDFIVQLYREGMRLAKKFHAFIQLYKQSLIVLYAAQLQAPPFL